MLDLTSLQSSSEHPSLIGITFAVLLAFICSLIIATTYLKTFRGLSFSQGFVQSLVLGSIVATIVMQAIGDSVGRGLGMLGAMAIVRFRTNIKDPRDIMFLFASLAIGIACGVSAFWVALAGSLFFSLTAWMLYKNPLGQENIHDGLIRFQSNSDSIQNEKIHKILKHHTKYFALVTLREANQGNTIELAYQFKSINTQFSQKLVQELKEISVTGIHLMMQENTGEL